MVKELLAYQETDAKLKAIEQEIANSEERRKTASAKKFLDGVNDSVAALEKRAKELSAVYESLLSAHAEFTETFREISAAADGAEDTNAAGYLQKKADELALRLANLESQASALSDEINGVLSSFSQLKKKTQAAKEQFNEYGQKYKELKQSREAERSAIEKELAALEKSVDAALMEKYKAKRKDKMFPVLYEVKGNMCGKCLMELSMSDLNRLKSEEVIECDNCRCLISKA
ncbi:MAG: hypothetical protein DBX59_10910 [Bacillota bacterium]|nr:MAG: hypothetical protein DBX59_10910 [Bacillota bacterium]